MALGILSQVSLFICPFSSDSLSSGGFQPLQNFYNSIIIYTVNETPYGNIIAANITLSNE
jgi:hypothetical protein